MRIVPIAAGVMVVAGLALANGATPPNVPPDDDRRTSEVVAEQHPSGKDKAGKDKAAKDKAAKDKGPRWHRSESDELMLPPGLLRKGHACFRQARYDGPPPEACPWRPHPHGKVVPARPYSETDE